MHKLIEYLCDELEQLERKVDKEGKLSIAEAQYGDMLAHFRKNLLKAEENEYSMAMESGYSRRGSYARGGSYAGNGGSYADGNSADGRTNYGSRNYVQADGSYARGRRGNVRRDSMGRYSRDDVLQDGLEELMEKAPNEQMRNEIRMLMERM